MLTKYTLNVGINLPRFVIFVFISAQASTGKQGVLGPTKIYLAVQPSNQEQSNETTSSNPPPLTPVQQPQAIQSSTQNATVSANIKQSPVKQIQPATVQQVCKSPQKSKVVVQPVSQALYNHF